MIEKRVGEIVEEGAEVRCTPMVLHVRFSKLVLEQVNQNPDLFISLPIDFELLQGLMGEPKFN